MALDIPNLQKQIDNNTLEVETFSDEQRAILDELIDRGALKGPKMDDLLEKRTEAAFNVARVRQIEADPLRAQRLAEGDEGYFSGRPGAELVGDLVGSIAPLILMRGNILKAAKAGKLLNRQTLTFGKAAQQLPDSMKFTKGVMSRLASVADLPERVVRSPLGQMELASIAGGTVGAGVGSVAYDLTNEAVGDEIVAAMTEDLGNIDRKEIDQDISLNAFEAMKNAALWNSGAALLGPIIGGVFGKPLSKLFGLRGDKAKELANFARDKGLPIPLISAMNSTGFLGPIAQNYFKTVGVFPGVSSVGYKAFQNVEQAMGRSYLMDLMSYSPLIRTSVLGHGILDQMNLVFKENVNLINSAYNKFNSYALAAGNPAVVSLTNTRRVANEMLDQLEASYPKFNRELLQENLKGVEELTTRGDPIFQFYRFINSIPEGNLTLQQYKGMKEMLNRAMETTNLNTGNIAVKQIWEASENDLAMMGQNLHEAALLKDAGIKEQYDKIAGAYSDPVTKEMAYANKANGDTFIKDIIDRTGKAADQLAHANRTFSNIMGLYSKLGLRREFAKADKNIFTQQALYGITGERGISRTAFFKKLEKDVFLSPDPEAINQFKKLIGAVDNPQLGQKTTANGKFLYRAGTNRYFFNTFLKSFDTAQTPGAKSIFNALETDPFIREGVEYSDDFIRNAAKDPYYMEKGLSVDDVVKGEGQFGISEIRFAPDDFAQFNINKFMRNLGIEGATDELSRLKLLNMLGKDHYNSLMNFTNYMKAVSDVPLSDSSTFIQRRFMLGSLGSVAGGLVIGAGAFAVNPFAPLVFMLLARQFGNVLADPVALRLMNDALLPDEMLQIAKTGKITVAGQTYSAKSGIYRKLTPSLTAAGLTRKRDAAARFLNYMIPESKDNPNLDLQKVAPEEITKYLSQQPFQVPNEQNYEDKVPEKVIKGMFVNDFIPKGTPEADIAQGVEFINSEKAAEQDTIDYFKKPEDTAQQTVDQDIQLAQQTGQAPQQPGSMQQADLAQALFPQDEILNLAMRRRNA